MLLKLCQNPLSNKRNLSYRHSLWESLQNTRNSDAKRSKIIQFIQFLAWFAGVCVLHLVLCQVQSKDWAKILTSKLGFERAIWFSRRPRRFNWWSGYYAIFKLSWYFCRKHISFVELVTVMRLRPLKLNWHPGRLLGHLRYLNWSL